MPLLISESLPIDTMPEQTASWIDALEHDLASLVPDLDEPAADAAPPAEHAPPCRAPGWLGLSVAALLHRSSSRR